MLPPVLKLVKIFGLNSSESPTRTNKWLLLLSAVLSVIFVVVLVFRYQVHQDPDNVQYAVSTLHLVCYVAMFIGSMASNWFNSKKYNQALIRVGIFDHYLESLGFPIDHKKAQRAFYVSLSTSSGVFLVVAVIDFVVDVVLTEPIYAAYWLTIYIPITLNFFSAFTIVFTLFLLKERFKTLGVYFEELLLPKSPLNIKQFTNFLLELVKISNLTVSIFSSQILTLFLFVFTTVTFNAYLMFKINFSVSQRVILFNFIAIHCGQLVVVVLAHFWTKQQAGKIITKSPKIITLQKTKTTFDENLECYFLIQDNQVSGRVFDMFAVDPAALLSISAYVVSYIIILVQFTTGKYGEGLNFNWSGNIVSRGHYKK